MHSKSRKIIMREKEVIRSKNDGKEKPKAFEFRDRSNEKVEKGFSTKLYDKLKPKTVVFPGY